MIFLLIFTVPVLSAPIPGATPLLGTDKTPLEGSVENNFINDFVTSFRNLLNYFKQRLPEEDLKNIRCEVLADIKEEKFIFQDIKGKLYGHSGYFYNNTNISSLGARKYVEIKFIDEDNKSYSTLYWIPKQQKNISETMYNVSKSRTTGDKGVLTDSEMNMTFRSNERLTDDGEVGMKDLLKSFNRSMMLGVNQTIVNILTDSNSNSSIMANGSNRYAQHISSTEFRSRLNTFVKAASNETILENAHSMIEASETNKSFTSAVLTTPFFDYTNNVTIRNEPEVGEELVSKSFTQLNVDSEIKYITNEGSTSTYNERVLTGDNNSNKISGNLSEEWFYSTPRLFNNDQNDYNSHTDATEKNEVDSDASSSHITLSFENKAGLMSNDTFTKNKHELNRNRDLEIDQNAHNASHPDFKILFSNSTSAGDMNDEDSDDGSVISELTPDVSTKLSISLSGQPYPDIINPTTRIYDNSLPTTTSYPKKQINKYQTLYNTSTLVNKSYSSGNDTSFYKDSSTEKNILFQIYTDASSNANQSHSTDDPENFNVHEIYTTLSSLETSYHKGSMYELEESPFVTRPFSDSQTVEATELSTNANLINFTNEALNSSQEYIASYSESLISSANITNHPLLSNSSGTQIITKSEVTYSEIEITQAPTINMISEDITSNSYDKYIIKNTTSSLNSRETSSDHTISSDIRGIKSTLIIGNTTNNISTSRLSTHEESISTESVLSSTADLRSSSSYNNNITYINTENVAVSNPEQFISYINYSTTYTPTSELENRNQKPISGSFSLNTHSNSEHSSTQYFQSEYMKLNHETGRINGSHDDDFKGDTGSTFHANIREPFTSITNTFIIKNKTASSLKPNEESPQSQVNTTQYLSSTEHPEIPAESVYSDFEVNTLDSLDLINKISTLSANYEDKMNLTRGSTLKNFYETTDNKQMIIYSDANITTATMYSNSGTTLSETMGSSTDSLYQTLSNNSHKGISNFSVLNSTESFYNINKSDHDSLTDGTNTYELSSTKVTPYSTAITKSSTEEKVTSRHVSYTPMITEIIHSLSTDYGSLTEHTVQDLSSTEGSQRLSVESSSSRIDETYSTIAEETKLEDETLNISAKLQNGSQLYDVNTFPTSMDDFSAAMAMTASTLKDYSNSYFTDYQIVYNNTNEEDVTSNKPEYATVSRELYGNTIERNIPIKESSDNNSNRTKQITSDPGSYSNSALVSGDGTSRKDSLVGNGVTDSFTVQDSQTEKEGISGSQVVQTSSHIASSISSLISESTSHSKELNTNSDLVTGDDTSWKDSVVGNGVTDSFTVQESQTEKEGIPGSQEVPTSSHIASSISSLISEGTSLNKELNAYSDLVTGDDTSRKDSLVDNGVTDSFTALDLQTEKRGISGSQVVQTSSHIASSISSLISESTSHNKELNTNSDLVTGDDTSWKDSVVGNGVTDSFTVQESQTEKEGITGSQEVPTSSHIASSISSLISEGTSLNKELNAYSDLVTGDDTSRKDSLVDNGVTDSFTALDLQTEKRGIGGSHIASSVSSFIPESTSPYKEFHTNSDKVSGDHTSRNTFYGNGVTHSLVDNSVTHSLVDNSVTHSLVANSVAHSLVDNSVTHSLVDNSVTHSLVDNSVTHSLVDNSVPHSLVDNSVTHSLDDYSVTYSLVDNSVTHSLVANSVAHSLVDNSVTHSLVDNSVTHSLVDNSVTHSLVDNSVPHSLVDNSVTHSLDDYSVTHSLVDNSLTHSLVDNSVTHSLLENSVTPSLVDNRVTNSLVDNSMTHSLVDNRVTHSLVDNGETDSFTVTDLQTDREGISGSHEVSTSSHVANSEFLFISESTSPHKEAHTNLEDSDTTDTTKKNREGKLFKIDESIIVDSNINKAINQDFANGGGVEYITRTSPIPSFIEKHYSTTKIFTNKEMPATKIIGSVTNDGGITKSEIISVIPYDLNKPKVTPANILYSNSGDNKNNNTDKLVFDLLEHATTETPMNDSIRINNSISNDDKINQYTMMSTTSPIATAHTTKHNDYISNQNEKETKDKLEAHPKTDGYNPDNHMLSTTEFNNFTFSLPTTEHLTAYVPLRLHALKPLLETT